MFADWRVCREIVYGYVRVFVMKFFTDMYVCLSWNCLRICTCVCHGIVYGYVRVFVMEFLTDIYVCLS